MRKPVDCWLTWNGFARKGENGKREREIERRGKGFAFGLVSLFMCL